MLTKKVEEIFGKGVKGTEGIRSEDYEDARYLPEYVFGGEIDEVSEMMDVSEEELRYLESEFATFYTLRANLKATIKGVNGDEMRIAYSFGSGYLWYAWVNEVGGKSFGRKSINF